MSVSPEPLSAESENNAARAAVSAADVQRVMIAPNPIIEDVRLSRLSEPFAILPFSRLPASQVIAPSKPGNPELQRRYIKEKDLTELWAKITELQERVVNSVRADRTNTDAYQRDLLYARTLLLEADANFEEAYQVYYMVKADLEREMRVAADIRRYRLPLVVYHLVWLIATVLAIGLDDRFRALIPESVSIMKLAWLPILSGVFGALFNGLMAIHEHTTVRRDFDPTHVTWYLINPIIGGMLGLVVFILFVVSASTFTANLITRPESELQSSLVIWLLAFIVGWQQNIVIQLLNRFLKSLTPNQTPNRPSAGQLTSPTELPQRQP
ncbi:MAG: hypothetical protein CUN49_09900 [Candidatus Thermofonsia Clade 1 bacterium]|jgi:hypothetical protein|uniref:Uncharacterized protein n=1 Tax=Candidatus Thermofonsia Clade 1 bacterium TaxID=2364210 RepID=A0A2M8PDE3_9CHLR|nr:MAG: hypothetical protein CUN49_09900 [Candidatus Thermofonsia Clade 1 bacterium]